ncbi:unnamed protein product, partial [Didymodactylos carnosus]
SIQYTRHKRQETDISEQIRVNETVAKSDQQQQQQSLS